MSSLIQKFYFLQLRRLTLAFFVASFFIFIFFPLQTEAAGPTFVTGVITEDQVWTKENSPYIINWPESGLTLHAKLTIQAGTVVKIYGNKWGNKFYGLKVDGGNGGILQVLGTVEEPVIFTSYFDDSYYNDADESEFSVAPGDYQGLTFINDHNSSLTNVEFNYCGSAYGNEGCLILDNSEVTFNNLKIKQSLQPGVLVKNNSQANIENLIALENSNEVLMLNDKSKIVLNNSNFYNNHGGYLITMSAASDLSGTNNNFYDNENQLIKLNQYLIDNSVTWRNFGLPYFASGEIKIAPIGQLNIEPGVLVRWDFYYSRLLNLGELNINGQEGREVDFQSFFDQPENGGYYWGGVVFDSGSTGQLNYLKIKDAGAYYTNWNGVFYGHVEHHALRITDASPLINHLTIEGSISNGLNIVGGSSPIIENCVIKNSGNWGVLSDSSEIVTFKKCVFENNVLGAVQNISSTVVDARNNRWGDNSGPKNSEHPERLGAQINGLVLYEPWQGKENLAVVNLEPVIVIPGITGSWQKYLIVGEWSLDPFMHTYDNLLEALRQAGYRENNNLLFPFPYQWRQDNVLTAEELKNKIQTVKNITGKNKVDLVVHSMGGLVARSYVQGDDYQNDVDQIIFLGTPQTGSVNAYVTWESGENLVKGATDFFPMLMNFLFKLEANYRGYDFDLFSYVRNQIKSVQQLLPIYDYLINNNANILRQYANNYPRNEFLENLNQAEEILQLKQRTQITNIVSDQGVDSTVEFLKVEPYADNDGVWEHGYPVGYNNISGDHGLIMGHGDATVPLKSANGLGNFPSIVGNVKHSDMPTAMQKDVIFALTGKVPLDLVKLPLFNGLNILKTFLLISLHSPIDVQIIDPSGHKVGKDFNNNTELNEIAGAYYTGFNGPTEFILIPNPIIGEYQLVLQGTGVGDYGVEMDFATEKETKTITVAGSVEPGQMIYYSSTLDEANLDNWQINPADDKPPIISLAPIKDKYLSSEFINVKIIDEQSGLSQVEIFFDNQLLPVNLLDKATSTELIIDLKNYSFGQHTLDIVAQDVANNNEHLQKSLEIYTDIDQIIKESENIWFKNKGIKVMVLLSLKQIKKDYQELAKLTNAKKIAILKQKIKLEINVFKKVLEGFVKIDLINNQGYQFLINNLNCLLSKL